MVVPQMRRDIGGHVVAASRFGSIDAIRSVDDSNFLHRRTAIVAVKLPT